MKATKFRFLTVAVSAGLFLSACSAGASTSNTSANAVPATSNSPAATATSSSADPSAAGTESSANTATSQAAPAAGDSALTVGFILEPTSLDFTQVDGAQAPQALLVNVYEGLVKQDDARAIVPALAKSWTVSADGTVYDFVLQSGVKFSNGDPFNAAAAKFSIERVKTGWLPSVKSGMDVVSAVDAVSDTELKVTLSKPSNSWLYAMTTRIGAMFSPNGVTDLANAPVGTGPYKFDSRVPGDNIVLIRNESYWGTPAAVRKVTLRYFQDPNAMNNALLTGGINVISSIQTPESMGQFADAAKYQTIVGSTNGEVLLTLNNATGPTADLKVRQAISYALDRKSILDVAWSGYGSLIGTHEAPTDPWFFDEDAYPFDPAKAKALLAETANPTPTLRLTLPPTGYASAAAPLVISQLADVGITVTDSNVTFPVWLDQVFKQADYDMTIINHVEPRDAAALFANPEYYPRYNNPQVQALFASADAGTPAQQITDTTAALKQIAQDAASVWLWSFPNLIVADANITGIPKNAIGEAFDFTTLAVS
ncbi:ABC transporter substrate-binding protein [Nakamurella antarctica]|uniref:ABC transporter substrate-binding protein n=1 Tax=Nakamurella antarctica TaxID=1902245 RepID=A0A3G8ZU83_9ACTN|nr:ABC transporter substrate-binding protein [Nakamurella antarctica]AZI58034.1 ABC transporter substrate-binding protein [Nakamurella antarctica]